MENNKALPSLPAENEDKKDYAVSCLPTPSTVTPAKDTDGCASMMVKECVKEVRSVESTILKCVDNNCNGPNTAPVSVNKASVEESKEMPDTKVSHRELPHTSPANLCHYCSTHNNSTLYLSCVCEHSFCFTCIKSVFGEDPETLSTKPWTCYTCRKLCKCSRCTQPDQEESKSANDNAEDTETEGTLIVNEWRETPYLSDESVYKGPKAYPNQELARKETAPASRPLPSSRKSTWMASPNSAFAPPQKVLLRERSVSDFDLNKGVTPEVGKKLPPISQFFTLAKEPDKHVGSMGNLDRDIIPESAGLGLPTYYGGANYPRNVMPPLSSMPFLTGGMGKNIPQYLTGCMGPAAYLGPLFEAIARGQIPGPGGQLPK